MRQLNETMADTQTVTKKEPNKEKKPKTIKTSNPNVKETETNETDETRELKILEKMLKFMRHDVDENVRTVNINREIVDNARKAAREKIRKLRVEMNAFFNKLEQVLDKTIERTRTDDLHKMTILSSECQALTDKITRLGDDIGKSLKDGKPCGLVEDMNKVRHDVRDLETTIRKVCKDNHVEEYVFEPSSDIVNMFDNIKQFGNLRCDVEKKKTVLKLSEVDMNAKADDEKLIPLLAGMTFVSDETLVATDYENRCLKLLNVKTYQLEGRFPVKSEPWDITGTKPEHFAVTFPMKKRIQCLKIHKSSFSLGREFQTNGECRGIDCKLGQLFVSYVLPGKVEILDLKGSVLKCFECRTPGTELFNWPGYISVTVQSSPWIYVSDKERDMVTRMTIDGQIDETFYGQTMKGPRGIAVDDKGCVYVCGRGSNVLCQILLKMNSVERLLERSDGLKQPHCLLWHKNRVYISSCGGQFIRSWEIV